MHSLAGHTVVVSDGRGVGGDRGVGEDGAGGGGGAGRVGRSGSPGSGGENGGFDSDVSSVSSTSATVAQITARLLRSVRAYRPGVFSSPRARFHRGTDTRRRRTNIIFIGEFGAGKSSVINTLLHVVAGVPQAEFTEVAPTGDGAHRVTQVSDQYVLAHTPDGGVDSALPIGLFDFAGFERFNHGEWRMMEELRKYGVRERARQFKNGLASALDIGKAPVPCHAFVWVFRMTSNSPGKVHGSDDDGDARGQRSGSDTSNHSHTSISSHSNGNSGSQRRRRNGSKGRAGGDGSRHRTGGVTFPTVNTTNAAGDGGLKGGEGWKHSSRGRRHSVHSSLTRGVLPDVHVTRKGVELDTEGRKLFQRFFSLACQQGMRPVVVLTHIDSFTASQVSRAKAAVSFLTGVGSNDIIAMQCYTSASHAFTPATHHAAAKIMDQALHLAERYEPSTSLIDWLDSRLYLLTLRVRGTVIRAMHAPYLLFFLCFLAILAACMYVFAEPLLTQACATLPFTPEDCSLSWLQ